RHYLVTGVQTCALPISVPSNPPARPINETTACAIRPPLTSLTVPVSLEVSSLPLGSETLPDIPSLTSPSTVRVRPGTPPDTPPRSEERRGGREGSTRAP